MNLQNIQNAIKEENLDGWLLYDFRGRDTISNRIAEISPNHLATRRWYYFIPAEGEPKKLVNMIEPHTLDHLPGEKIQYMPWKELPNRLKEIIGGKKNIAVQYWKNNNNPYISVIDAGTYELLQSLGYILHSSGNLVAKIEAHLNEDEKQTHIEAGKRVDKIKWNAFKYVGEAIKSGNLVTEFDVYNLMKRQFEETGLFADHGPIVAINEHAADPHFEPDANNCQIIKAGDLILFDIFAKMNTENAVWYDITWMGYAGADVPERISYLFDINMKARDKGIETVKEFFSQGKPLSGAYVDDQVRNVINAEGLGQYFIHRTGHNITSILHGNGAHIDNFETNDERLIIKGSCFSIEPGIYIPDEKIGFRSEVDVWVSEDGSVDILGEVQHKMVNVLDL